jgi:predicted ATP-dependent endonuclease of OLD family
MLGYANKTGASSFHGAKPNFEGSLSETELFSALQLIIKYETGIEVAATHNGVGYNNLIYISLLLSKMQACTDGSYMGINAKTFPVLAIEEPEAHLHPSLQYKLLEFLKDEIREGSVRQLFVTTHSTHITSSINLKSMICLYDDGNDIKTAYPATLFPDNDEGKKSLSYVQRFLDVTKSNMLFADKIIFVEGLAEGILVPTFVKLMGIDLDEKHIAVIAVDGR